MFPLQPFEVDEKGHGHGACREVFSENIPVPLRFFFFVSSSHGP